MSEFLKPRAVIFDMDGTLIDTFPAIVTAWNAGIGQLLGRTFTPQEVVARFGPTDEGMMNEAFPDDLSEEGKHEVIERYFRAYRQAHENITPFDGIDALLKFLSEKGMPLGVMTGKGRRACDETLKYFGWEGRFGSVITGDETTEPKPNPDGVLKVARALGVEPKDCMFVGDSPADIGAAENAGMFSVVAGWHDFYREELKVFNPNLWPETPAELQKWLEARLG